MAQEKYIQVTQNDIKEYLNFTLQNSAGTATDITGYSAVNLLVQRPGESTLKFTGTMEVVSATAGTVKYLIASGDFDKVGKYFASIKVTFTNGQILTFPGIVIDCAPALPRA